MAALTDREKALVLGLELLRKQLQDNALGVAANTQATEDDYKARAKAIAAFMDGAAVRPAADASGGGFGGAPSVQVRDRKKEDTNPGPGGVETKENKAEREAAAKAKFNTDKARGAAAAGKVMGNPIMQVLSEVAGKFAAIIGPAAVLSAVLNSTVSGFGTLQTSVKVFASTLAPVLLPATLMLSSVFLGMADIVNEHGELIEAATDLLMRLVAVVEVVIQWLDEAADHIQEMNAAAEEFADWVRRNVNSLNPFSDDEQAAGRDALSATDGAKDATAKGMRDALQSLRQSIGPRSTTTGLGSVGAAVQSAALNADPLEARLLKQQLEALNRIEGKLPGRNRAGRPVYDPEARGAASNTGAGDYEHGSSSGGGGDYGEGA